MILRPVARWSLLALCASASAFALLCSIPFTWTNFIVPRNYPPAAGLLLRAHPWLFAAAAALATAELLRTAGRTRALLWGAPALLLAAAGLWKPPLSALSLDGWSFFWALAAWAPTLAWEAALPAACAEPLRSAPERSLFLAPFAAALTLFVGGTLAGLVDGLPGPFSGTLIALWRSALLHASFAAAAAVLLSALRALLRLPVLRGAGIPLIGTLLLFAVAFALERTLLAPLSVQGSRAVFYALCAGAGLCAPLLGLLRETSGKERPPLSRALVLLAAALVPFTARKLFAVDWDFMLQTLSVYGAWALAFGAALRLPWERLSVRTPPAWKPAVLCTLLLWTTDAGLRAADPLLRWMGMRPGPSLQTLLERDPATRTLARLLRRPAGDSDLFRFLQSRTNLARSVSVHIPERSLLPVGASQPAPPDVFVFVIDSLRPDYLGAYNPAVRFTPSFDALARESAVFRRAFTTYGGTGLSEPAIWTGARLPHQQYPPGLPRMNVLEKLIAEGRYLPILTLDQVLKSILSPPPDLRRLDAKNVENFALCGTLGELETLLPTLPKGRPLFVYTQPQDVHVATIDRAGRKALDSSTYPGFHAPYASRVARMDACFGRFTAALKRSGLWEDSIIVLTSDHGDSLGEGGRWGHAFTVYPEVLSVPLILRVPPRLRAGLAWDPERPALLLDVAPTLAALLGRKPSPSSPLAGRPLFRPAGEAAPPRPEELVASSYAPVYGLLLDEGRRLYIADGVSYQERLFELDVSGSGRPAALSPEESARGRAGVRAWLERIDAAYGVHPD